MLRTVLSFGFALVFAIGMKAVNSGEQPLLTGKLNVDYEAQVMVSYDMDGEYVFDKLSTTPDGAFVFNPAMTGDSLDVAIQVGNSIFGALLQKGKTVNIDIDGDKARFSGDNVEIAEYLSACNSAFDYMKYKPTPDRKIFYDSAMASLDSDYKKACDIFPAMSASSATRYKALAESRYKALKCFIISGSQDGDAHRKEAEAIIASVDPDSDEARLSGLLSFWSMANPELRDTNASGLLDMSVSEILRTDSLLSNQSNKTRLYIDAVNSFMAFEPTDGDIEKFRTSVAASIDKSPRAVAVFDRLLAERSKNVSDGDMLPCDPVVITPEGTRHSLSSLFDGKIVYIDLWATWCGPCCREIPFLDKVAEAYKDNDRVKFISISCDQDRDAWLRKLAKDNPSWPQFIFDEKTGNEFMTAMKANGIPRFFLIGRDGRFISVNAVRPSHQDIKSVLDNAIATK